MLNPQEAEATFDRSPALRSFDYRSSGKRVTDVVIASVALVLSAPLILLLLLIVDMSIVGPRPVVADELLRYGSDAEAYKSVRPGLTGPWQVSGRNLISYSDRVALDAAYVRNLSFLRDMSIMFGTARSVVLRTGQ